MGNPDSELVEGFVTDMSVQCDTPEGRVCQQPENCQCIPAVQEWHEPAVPRHVLQMFVYDESGKVLVMHRSEKVRSARNVWSIPTGTHEIGESIASCLERELMEEFDLQVKHAALLDQYENIAGDEAPPHYHWVLSVYGVQVEDVTAAANKEPDRHDQMIFVPAADLTPEFFAEHKFHSSFHDIIRLSAAAWAAQLGLR